MKVEDLIYDVLEIKNAVNDDSAIDELWILQKINFYRAALIGEQVAKTGDMDPSWVQRYPAFDFLKVTSSDNPGIDWGSIELGKFTLPEIVSLPHDEGLVLVMNASRSKPLSLTDFATLTYRASLEDASQIPPGSAYVAKLGNDIYIWPYIMKGQAHIIAANPMDVPVIDGGQIREATFTDNYPIDPAMAQMIILSILTKDLKLSEESIPDIINDSQDQLKIMKTDGKGQ